MRKGDGHVLDLIVVPSPGVLLALEEQSDPTFPLSQGASHISFTATCRFVQV